MTIQEQARSNNNLKIELTIALEEAETRLLSEKSELLCVHFWITQLMFVTDHQMKDMNSDIETAKSNNERQLV